MVDLDFGPSYTRRMPVYLLLPSGQTLAGARIQALEQNVMRLRNELLGQPEAVEKIWLSVITFASGATQQVPLTPISDLPDLQMSAHGRNDLGAALRLLIDAVKRETIRPTAQTRGDYKPLVFLMLAADPTDRWEAELASLDRAHQEQRIGNIIALLLGDSVESALARQITPSVLRMADVTPGHLSAFFKWTSVSLTAVSQRASSGPQGDAVTLPTPPESLQVEL